MTKHDITRLFAYTEWANHLTLDAAEQRSIDQLTFDFGTGQHSIFETLVHMLGAEWIWLERWEGQGFRELPNLSHPFEAASITLFPHVRSGWLEIESARRLLLAGLT